MQDIRFDFNNMLSANIGAEHGVTEAELKKLEPAIKKAHAHFRSVSESPANRVNLSLEWLVLPFQDKKAVASIQALGEEISRQYESVISLGIGGSYLGLKAAQEALAPPYYNEFASRRGNRARIYFEGNNLDPTPLAVLLENLDPKKTFVVVISKSGETTETKAAFDIVEDWLKKGVGEHYGRQIVAITDPKSGSLRQRVKEAQAKDPLSFRNFSLTPGVGGRYSEFNMGLLHLAMIGVDIQQVLDGARDMAKRCSVENYCQNPAYLYAALHYLAYRRKGKTIAIFMPFTELLTSTANWYCQLLAESTGKKFTRQIKVSKDGAESWAADPRGVVHAGRTPVPTRGTTDLHSIQQNNVEGENDKVATMIRVDSFRKDLKVPASGGILAGKSLGTLLGLAQEATEWALVRNQRPNCTVSLTELTPWTWGGLLYFFEMATAFEGELLNVNAFDQPGVESYKNYMYYQLKKPGISGDVSREIEKHPVKRDPKYIL
jgi:glucose-6-phosphate isomerase